jgi:hypothetical protein
MSCHEFENWMQAQLDGVNAGTGDGQVRSPLPIVAEPPELSAHLADCGPCRELYRAARLMQGGLKAQLPATVSFGLSERIVARVLAERRARRVWRYRLIGAAAVAAAALLFAPVLGRYFLPPDPVLPGSGEQQTNTDDPKKKELAQPGPSLNSSVAEAGQAVVELTGRLADETQKQARLLLSAAPRELPPMDPTNGMGEPNASFAPARQSLENVGRSVGVGVQSVANTTQQAINYFGRELPNMAHKIKGS